MKTKTILRHTPKIATTSGQLRQGYHSNNFFDRHSTNKKNYYHVTLNKKLESILKKASELKQEIDSYQDKMSSSLREAMYKSLRASWTYNSNAIEGSSFSLGDTIFFLEEGLTLEGKPFKDYLDIINHVQAIDFVYQNVGGNIEINTSFIKQINSIVLGEITSYTSPRAHAQPAEYRKHPNYRLLLDGKIHKYVEPLLVERQMDELCDWIHNNLESTHPIITAAIAHYNMTRIHPFDYGNGKCSQILMNTILLSKKYHPAVIMAEKRKEYLTCLSEADETGDVNRFTEFVGRSLITTQETALQAIREEFKIGSTPTNR